MTRFMRGGDDMTIEEIVRSVQFTLDQLMIARSCVLN